MLGDGITQGRPASTKFMARRQPRIGTTVRSPSIGRANRAPPHGIPGSRSRATSAMVNPCLTGIAPSPTNDSYASPTVPPSMASPPSGFGRSRTITATPARKAASIANTIVQMYV